MSYQLSTQKSGALANPLHIYTLFAHKKHLYFYSLLTDARYLHEKFTILKTAGAPTALLETLVTNKHVGVIYHHSMHDADGCKNGNATPQCCGDGGGQPMMTVGQ